MKDEKHSGDGWKNLLADAIMLLPMLKEGGWGRYKSLPWWCIALPVLAALYVVSPLDFMPDVIPVLGQLDDAGIILLCFKLLQPEIERYRNWRDERSRTIDVKAVNVSGKEK